jgi:catechol 2,3-dioxygenase
LSLARATRARASDPLVEEKMNAMLVDPSVRKHEHSTFKHHKPTAIGGRVRASLRHVAIHVWDLPRMAAFYEGVLGLLPTDGGRGANAPVDFMFYTAEPNMHHQFVLVSGRPKDATSSLLNQLSFHVETLADVKAIHAKALSNGATDMRAMSHGNAWSIYFRDPEQNRIEVYTDTPWYVPQPHGDPIDITLSEEEIRRATEAICRKDPAFCTREAWEQRTTERLKS